MLLKYRTKIFALAEEQKLQQAKDELLSLASHQLRTPATGVKQYVGMVLDGFGGPVPKDQAKLLEQAYKSNERQLQIINEFLYVAKLGSGSLITTKHKFDLAPLVRDVISEMDMDVKERHHSIKTKIPKSVPIKADEHSVRMIIENLLSNAIKYTQPGGKIAVELKQSTREAVIVVKDNGVGISKRDQKQLFKQFSRIPNELTNEVSGSGIGLYLAQQLAVRNGGKITVESEPARGSTFTLTLPNWRVKKITMTRRGA
jgi:signal transduction histidine kinase